MDILKQIVAHKQEMLSALKSNVPENQLEQIMDTVPSPPSLLNSLLSEHTNGIIAEFKRESPSAGLINSHANPAEVARGYTQAGCAGISVLTDQRYFGGTAHDFRQVNAITNIPLLRKDFIIDPYQIVEARSMGASAVLLIASILDKSALQDYVKRAHELGMEVLLEIHNEQEISKIPAKADIVGINNRNLQNFNVNLSHAAELKNKVPNNFPLIAESGISGAGDIAYLLQQGFTGVLIGSMLMKQKNPGQAMISLNAALKKREFE